MKKNSKLFLTISIFTAIFSGLSLVSCATTEDSTKLKNNIPTGLNYYPNIEDPKEAQTHKLIDNLVVKVFGDDGYKKTEFLKSQERETKLFTELKELTQEFKTSQNANKLKQFYSRNWLFIIKNIKKLQWTFTEWWKFPNFENAKHTDEFLENLNSLPKPNDFKFNDNNWDQFKEGDESFESSDNIFYLKKDNFIIRIYISRNEDKTVNFNHIILFPNSKIKNISIQIISDAVHNALIHKQQSGFNSFEEAAKKLFGNGAIGLLLLKDDEQ
ncbi:hypothetical protein N8G13_02200 [Mycoplasma zalophi]|uniref:aromatic motif membrane protein n=1 Tax=Mycoplasma zalophi TaxID=191287 RepID=UPI0021C82207|nr:aromatic motif membrane protein [Mycoplasma zalophi]MCU4117267.1 hypothetical protein [Mycoplasma zalophi]